MPEFADYNVWLLDHQAEKTGGQLFPGDDFLSIAWQRKLNGSGVYRLELVAETATKDRFIIDYQVLIERNITGNMADWYEEFVGFHLDEEEWYETDDTDAHYWASICMSSEHLVDKPLLQPLRNTGNDNWMRYDTWWAFDTADNVIKLMVGENMVDAVDEDRNFSQVSVAGNEGAGEQGCYDGSWVRLLDAIEDTIGEDGQRGKTDWRIERIEGGYQFRTYSPWYGTDRREDNADGVKPTVFSLELGNMRNPRRSVIRHAEVTAAYGGWQGGGMERTIYLEENATAQAESPYRRREEFYDLRDVTTPDSVSGILQQKLVDDGKVEQVEFELVQTGATLYGRDWNLGDLCTARVFGSTYDVRITEVLGRLDAENEEIIEGRAELWTRGDVV